MLQNLPVALLAVVAWVFILDTVLRVAGVRPVNLRPPIHQASAVPGLEYELKASLHTPGFRSEIVSTDSRGFRSEEIVKGKPVIAILGDSYAFGFGVADDETNPAVIATRFPESAVVNTGVNGYNIEQEALTYEAKMAELKPAVTVLESTPNDGDRKAFFDRDIADRAKSGSGTRTIAGPGWWLRTSPLADIVKRGLKRMNGPSSSATFVVEWHASELAYYERWLDRLSHDIGKHPKLLVLWPDYADRPKTFEAIKAMAARRGWKILDLQEILGTRFERLGWDSHPSAGTQKIAGTAIAEALLALGVPRGISETRVSSFRVLKAR